MLNNAKIFMLFSGLIVLILGLFMLKPLFYFLFLHLFLPDKTEHMKVNSLRDMPRDSVVLLDTRQYEEYTVSHLEGARWVGFDNFSISKVDTLPKNATIVVYCSVGYRSDLVGKKLKDAGFNKVTNLWGGIFAWTNRGLPLYADGKQTQKIHPYSTSWGFWLSKGEKSYGTTQEKAPQ